MKEFIKYYYLINVTNNYNFKETSYFSDENENYFMLYQLEEENIKDLNNIIDILNTTKIQYHLIVLNKDNTFISDFNNKKMILLKLRCLPDCIVPFDFDNLFLKKGTNNWGELWQERINYYEIQLNEIVNNVAFKNYIQYYLGIAEVAIYNYFKIKKHFSSRDEQFSLCHKKVGSPNYAIDYLNPFNFQIDYYIRDLAEYIKSAFFNDSLDETLVFNIISKNNFNDMMANMLLIRLMYPNYIFEYFDDYVLTKSIDTKIYEITKKSKKYEFLLRNLINKISLKNNIIIDIWITKFQRL